MRTITKEDCEEFGITLPENSGWNSGSESRLCSGPLIEELCDNVHVICSSTGVEYTRVLRTGEIECWFLEVRMPSFELAVLFFRALVSEIKKAPWEAVASCYHFDIM